MTIEQGQCPNKAECIYPWAGKLMKACRPHTRTMEMLAEAIGAEIEIRALPPNNEPCMHMDDLEKMRPKEA